MRAHEVLFLSTTLCLLSCDGGRPGDGEATRRPGDAIAVVDGFVIREDDLEAALRRKGVGTPDRPDTPAARREVLDELILFRSLLARAFESGYDENAAVISKFHDFVVRQYEADELARRTAALTVTEEEIEAYFRENLAAGGRPEMVHPALIRISVAPDATAAAREERLAVARRARALALTLPEEVATLGDAARELSDDGSRSIGGDIGWLSRENRTYRWDSKVIDAAFALANPGDISPIIATEKAFFIVRLIERRDAAAGSIEKHRETIRRHLLGARKEAAIRTLHSESREKSRIWIAESLQAAAE